MCSLTYSRPNDDTMVPPFFVTKQDHNKLIEEATETMSSAATPVRNHGQTNIGCGRVMWSVMWSVMLGVSCFLFVLNLSYYSSTGVMLTVSMILNCLVALMKPAVHREKAPPPCTSTVTMIDNDVDV